MGKYEAHRKLVLLSVIALKYHSFVFNCFVLFIGTVNYVRVAYDLLLHRLYRDLP